MAMTSKEKELAAVGISVAAGCKPCTDFHVKKVREAGASDSEIRQAMSDALAVRRGATQIMEAYGLAHTGQGKSSPDMGSVGKTDRVKELVCIGAAFGVNCVSSLEAHLEAAESLGIPHEDIATIVKLSAFIKGKAASHVERLAESLEQPEAVYEKAVSALPGGRGRESVPRPGSPAALRAAEAAPSCCPLMPLGRFAIIAADLPSSAAGSRSP